MQAGPSWKGPNRPGVSELNYAGERISTGDTLAWPLRAERCEADVTWESWPGQGFQSLSCLRGVHIDGCLGVGCQR